MKKVRKAKLFVFLRKHRHELFDQAFQEELAELYRKAERGQPQRGEGRQKDDLSRKGRPFAFPSIISPSCVSPSRVYQQEYAMTTEQSTGRGMQCS